MTGIQPSLPLGVSSRRLGLMVRVFLSTLLASLLVACGDDPPGPRGQGSSSYWTTDMSLVKIWFAYVDPAIPADRKPDLVLPRAFIRMALPYEWPNPKVLPDELRQVKTVYVFMATDTGEPLPLAAERESSAETLWGYDRARYVSMTLNKSFYPKDIDFWRGPLGPGAWTLGAAIDDDGFVRTPSVNGLYEISLCGKSRPPSIEGFCAYSALITPKIHIKANFSDYRAHGGLAYAERVLSLIKSEICKYNLCAT